MIMNFTNKKYITLKLLWFSNVVLGKVCVGYWNCKYAHRYVRWPPESQSQHLECIGENVFFSTSSNTFFLSTYKEKPDRSRPTIRSHRNQIHRPIRLGDLQEKVEIARLSAFSQTSFSSNVSPCCRWFVHDQRYSRFEKVKSRIMSKGTRGIPNGRGTSLFLHHGDHAMFACHFFNISNAHNSFLANRSWLHNKFVDEVTNLISNVFLYLSFALMINEFW